jgi:S1-C subfamily serine protease
MINQPLEETGTPSGGTDGAIKSSVRIDQGRKDESRNDQGGTMRTLTRILLIFVLCVVVKPSWAQESPGAAIVKVYTVYAEHDYDMPWQTVRQERKVGSGCIIEGKRVLTNAHVVADHTFIQVKRAGDGKKYTAQVEAVAHACDLAILKVSDDSFFSGVKPLELGPLSKMGDKVAVYGFPTGGEELCITEGVVSRVEYRGYVHSRAHLLACQIDAAINSGSSGGPVIKDGKIVGIAFQSVRSGENIGYMVPVGIIDHFLRDMKDGKYDGIPSLEISWQTMENPSLRSKYQMSEGQSGVLITHLPPGSPAEQHLRVGDVILSIDDKPIGNDGKISFRDNERIHFEFAVHSKSMGDSVQFEVLREKKVTEVSIPVTVSVDSLALVPFRQHDRPPTYYILGGLVFQPLTGNYLDTWGKLEKAPPVLVSHYYHGKRSQGQSQVIVLAGILGGEVTVGYEDAQYHVISEVNGVEISSMADLVRAIEHHSGAYHTVTDERGHQIVLERAKIAEQSETLLKRYKIKSDRSDDLKENDIVKAGRISK